MPYHTCDTTCETCPCSNECPYYTVTPDGACYDDYEPLTDAEANADAMGNDDFYDYYDYDF